MKLILIRHGESEKNAGTHGRTNGLTSKGKVQVKETSKKLMDEKIDVVYCSPTKRCEETLNEIIKNRSENMQISFTRTLGPKRKVETLEQLEKRIELFLEDLIHDHIGDETVVVVSHNMPIRMVVFKYTGEDMTIENGSITTFEVTDKVIRRLF
jgi:broad specificity phosphatase PhoE